MAFPNSVLRQSAHCRHVRTIKQCLESAVLTHVHLVSNGIVELSWACSCCCFIIFSQHNFDYSKLIIFKPFCYSSEINMFLFCLGLGQILLGNLVSVLALVTNEFFCLFFSLLPTGNNSATTELAIIISLSVGLLLLFVLLIFVINRSRKKSQRDRIRNEVVDQAQSELRVILCFFLSLPCMQSINESSLSTYEILFT